MPEDSKLIFKNFDNASNSYNDNAEIQKKFATKLAKECAKIIIPPGLWLDLGSGTGLLSEAIEKLIPNHSILRIDFSEKMLSKYKANQKYLLWDLNNGIPPTKEKPSFIASSFALQWLREPQLRLKEWFDFLSPGGLMAIAVPLNQSFPEWRNAANDAQVKFTAIPLPTEDYLLRLIPKANIKHNQKYDYIQSSNNIFSLLKGITKVGAGYTSQKSIGISEWKRVKEKWANSKDKNKVELTWCIQILLIQK